jgi:3-oxosteroid 1-dehydrogenase
VTGHPVTEHPATAATRFLTTGAPGSDAGGADAYDVVVVGSGAAGLLAAAAADRGLSVLVAEKSAHLGAPPPSRPGDAGPAPPREPPAAGAARVGDVARGGAAGLTVRVRRPSSEAIS